MKQTPAQNWAFKLLRLYPGAWRERYAEEVAAILEERPATLRTLFDLLLGIMDAYLHSDLFTERKFMVLQRIYKGQLRIFCLAILVIFPWLGAQISHPSIFYLTYTSAAESIKFAYYNSLSQMMNIVNLAGTCVLLATLAGAIVLLKVTFGRIAAPQRRGIFTVLSLSVVILLIFTFLFYGIAILIDLLLLACIIVIGPLALFFQARKIAVTTRLLRTTTIPALVITLAMSIMSILLAIIAVTVAISVPEFAMLKRAIFFDFDTLFMLLLTSLSALSLWKGLRAKRDLFSAEQEQIAASI